ncbi:MAG: hypothetical protein AAGA90_12215 [Actinomycetota bacterium]
MSSTTTRPGEPTAMAADRRRMLGGGAVLSAAMVVAGLGNYLVNAVAARLLDPTAFGDASFLITLLLLLTAAAGCLQLVTARRVAQHGATRGDVVDRLARLAWLGGASIGGVLVLGAPFLASTFGLGSAVPVVILGVGVPWYLAQAVERGLLQGRAAFGGMASTFVAETVVRCAATIALLVVGVGVTGVGLGLAASFVGSYLAARFANRSVERTEGHVVPVAGISRDLGAMSVMLLAQIVTTNADLLVVKALADGADAGRYAAVAVLGRAVFFCSWSVVTALFPFSAAAESEREVRTIRRGGLLVLTAGGLVATAGAAWFGGVALRVVFGSGYGDVAAALTPYVAATSLFTLANFAASVQAARGDLRAARVLLAGAIAQTVAVVAVGSDIYAAATIQLPVMALTAAAVLAASRPSITRR